MSLSRLSLSFVFLSAVSSLLRAAPSGPVDTSRLPMMFEHNSGQFARGIDFMARGPGYVMALKSGELLMSLKGGGQAGSTLVRCRLAGATLEKEAAGEESLACRMSYFLGNDPARWRTDVPTFAKVRYANVYPGVDLVYYGNQREIEYDFIVAPGADAGQVAVEFADEVRLDAASGELVVQAGGGELRHRAPVAWQMSGTEREPVVCRYVLTAERTAGFSIGGYDASRPLIIDPIISYSTYLGSSDYEEAMATVVDGAGNTYVTGKTDGDGTFDSGSNLDRNFNGGTYDAFVLKLNADGTTILQGTLIGGDGTDTGMAIAVDAGGNVYVAGDTDSVEGGVAMADRPYSLLDPTIGTRFGYDKTSNGSYDAFVLRLNSTFSAITYATFLGGPNDDQVTGIALAPDGKLWVCGLTGGDWSFTGAAAATGDTTFNGGFQDGFVLKLNPLVTSDNTGLEYFTYHGGNGNESADGIATDTGGNVYVTGYTYSPNFPLASPFQNLLNGLPAGSPSDWSDAFITKFSPAGAILRSSFHGGSRNDLGKRVTVDANGRAYLLGTTGSANFPVLNAAQSVHGTDPFLDELMPDMFVTRLNPDATAKEYSTLLGGDGDEIANSFVVDSQFNVFIAGESASDNFPLAHAWDSTLGGAWDGVLTKLSPDGDRFMVSTYIGGSGVDGLTGVGLTSQGIIHVCGVTLSSDLPVTPGAMQSNLAGTAADLFFQRIGINSQPPGISITSPLGPARALLTPFTGTTDDNDLPGVQVRVQVLELNPVVRYWTGAAWQNAAANGSGPWINATRAGLGWSVDPALMPGRAQTSPGTYTLRAQAEDADGNVSSLDSTNAVRNDVDTTPPVITFTNPSQNGAVLTSSNPALTFSIADAETGVGVVTVALRKSENGIEAYWNGTAWQAAFIALAAAGSAGSYSVPNPPSGANRPNAEYVLVAGAANMEAPPLESTQGIGFSVDFHPAYTWTGLSKPPNNSWIDPDNWGSTDTPGSFPGDGAIVEIIGGTPAIAGGAVVTLNRLRIAGGTLTNFGTLYVTKRLEMAGGSLIGSTQALMLFGGSDSVWTSGTITGTMTINENALLTVTGLGNYKELGAASRSGIIDNRGTMRWTGDAAAWQIRGHGASGPATINNESTGVFDIAGNGAPLYHINPNNLTFNNRGRIVKSAGVGGARLDLSDVWTLNLEQTSVLENAVSDAGSVLERTGTGAVTNVKSGAKFRGPGRIRFAGGTPVNAEAGSWTIENAAALDFHGMTLAGPQTGGLTLNPSADSVLRWLSGTIHGNLNIPAGVTLTVTGLGAYKELGASGLQGTINNSGIIVWTGDASAWPIRGHGGPGPATIYNLPHARFLIQGDGAPLYHINPNNCVFNNDGRIVKTAGAGVSSFDESHIWVLNNSAGAFIENAVAGSVLQRAGTGAVTNLAPGSVFYGPGTVRFAAGTPVNALPGALDVVGDAVLHLDGMTLACPQTGSLTLQPSAGSTLRWTSGTVHGNLDIPAGATLVATGTGTYKELGAEGKPGVLNNRGTILWTGDASAWQIRGFGGTGAATINNETGGVFDIAGNGAPLYHINPNNLTFTNRGRIVKSEGDGGAKLDVSDVWTFNLEQTSILENAVSDAGSVLERAGTGAVTNVKPGTIFRGPGRIRFSAGTPLNAEAGNWLIEGAPFDLAGMTLACPQSGSLALQPSGGAVLTWRSGTIHGNLDILAGSSLIVTGLGAYKELGTTDKQGTINNRGTIHWTGDASAWQIRGHGASGPATINNESAGVFDIAGNGAPLYHINPNNLTFNNRGRIVKSEGTGGAKLDVSDVWTFNLEPASIFENAVSDAGSVLERAGAGALTNVKPGAIFRGPGRIRFSGGTPLNATATGTWTLDGAVPFDLAGMTLSCPETGGLTLQTTGGSTLRWISGTIHGLLNIPSGTLLELASLGSYKELGAEGKPGTINNAGTITHPGDALAWPIRGFGSTGPATINNQAGGVLNFRGSGQSLNHQASGNTLINAGTINIGSSPGAVTMTWDFTQSATGVLNIELAGSAASEFDRLAISGAATLGGTVNGIKLNGYAPAIGTTFGFLTASSVTGTFATVTGGFAADYSPTSATLRVAGGGLSFDSWAASNGLSGPNALPNANPDGDDQSNFSEYVHNTSPTTGGPAPHGTGTTNIGGQDWLVLNYRRWDDREAAGVVYTPQTGNGSAAWSGAGIIDEVDPNAPVIPGSTACRCRVPIDGPDSKLLRVLAVKP